MRLLILVAVLGFPVFGGDRTRLKEVDPFCAYAGRWVEVQKPVNVVKRFGMWGGSEGVRSHRKADYGLVETNRTYEAKILSVLPVGHRVFIKEVRSETWIDDQEMIAYGRTTLPENNKEVTFAYSWGSVWTLWPAPWEPENTPVKRGPPGKLPPHFDYPNFYPPEGTPQWGLRGCAGNAESGSISVNGNTNAVTVTNRAAVFGDRVSDAPRVGDAPRVPDAKW